MPCIWGQLEDEQGGSGGEPQVKGGSKDDGRAGLHVEKQRSVFIVSVGMLDDMVVSSVLREGKENSGSAYEGI